MTSKASFCSTGTPVVYYREFALQALRIVQAGLPATGPDSHEIGKLAVWTVTSAKPGNGVELLRDDRDDTYWQSDGMQPHLINIHFQKKVMIFPSESITHYQHALSKKDSSTRQPWSQSSAAATPRMSA